MLIFNLHLSVLILMWVTVNVPMVRLSPFWPLKLLRNIPHVTLHESSASEALGISLQIPLEVLHVLESGQICSIQNAKVILSYQSQTCNQIWFQHTTSTPSLTSGPVYSNAPYAITSDSRGDNTAQSRSVRFDPADPILRRHGAAEVTPVNESRRHVHVYMKSIAAYRTHTHAQRVVEQ